MYRWCLQAAGNHHCKPEMNPPASLQSPRPDPQHPRLCAPVAEQKGPCKLHPCQTPNNPFLANPFYGGVQHSLFLFVDGMNMMAFFNPVRYD